MPYALVPMVANVGTVLAGNHPLSLDFGGNAIQISDTLALGWTPSDIPDGRVQTICDDKLDTMLPARRALLGNLLTDRTLTATDRFNDIVGNMYKTPPAGAAWGALRPHMGRGQLEVLLGPGNFLGAGPSNPGLLWSQVADVRGPHSQATTDTFNRANGNVSGSTSSDGLFTWTLVKGASARIQISSNQAVTTRAGTDVDIVLLSSLSMDTADVWAQTDCSMTGTKNYVGPFFRATTGDLTGADSGYVVQIDVGFSNIFAIYTANPVNLINSVATGGVTSGSLYGEIVGTTYVVRNNGVVKLSGTNSGANTDGSAGHRKVGIESGAYASDSNSVSIDNFYANDYPSTAQVMATVNTHVASGGIFGRRWGRR